MYAYLTLDKVVTIIWQLETVHRQQVFLHGDNETRQIPIDKVKISKRPVNSDTSQGSGPSKQTKCLKCGKSPNHNIGVCPVKGVICRKRGKKGHFQWPCRSKKISSIPRQSDKSFYLGIVSNNKEPWSVTLRLNSRSTNFCTNTGAEVTVISEKVYAKIGSPELKTLDRTLKGPSSDQLACKGRFIG